MRFLILTQYYPPEVGAPQVRLEAMANALTRRGHEVEVVTALPNHPNGRIYEGYGHRLYMRESLGSTTVHRVWIYAATGAGAKRIVNYLSFTVLSLFALCRCRRPAVLFVESPPLSLIVPAWLMGLLWRRPIVFNVADLWPDVAVEMGLLTNRRAQRVFARFERWSYRRATLINAVTDGIRRTLVENKGVPERKVTFLPNGVDLDLFQPGVADPETLHTISPGSTRVIVYAGTLGLAHGLDVAVDAMVQVARTHPEARLLLVGGGSDAGRLAKRITDERIANVCLIGSLPVAQVAKILRVAVAGLATLQALPHFRGARPSKIFPIMASGIPVLYSGRGEGADIVREAGAGIVVEPGNPLALAQAVIDILEHPDRASTMGARGRTVVTEHFSWDTLVDDWLDQLRDRADVTLPHQLRPH